MISGVLVTNMYMHILCVLHNGLPNECIHGAHGCHEVLLLAVFISCRQVNSSPVIISMYLKGNSGRGPVSTIFTAWTDERLKKNLNGSTFQKKAFETYVETHQRLRKAFEILRQINISKKRFKY